MRTGGSSCGLCKRIVSRVPQVNPSEESDRAAVVATGDLRESQMGGEGHCLWGMDASGLRSLAAGCVQK